MTVSDTQHLPLDDKISDIYSSIRLYFDALGDRLVSKVAEGTPVIDIELRRIEMRTPKPQIPVKQQVNEETNGSVSFGSRNGSAGSKLESPEVD